MAAVSVARKLDPDGPDQPEVQASAMKLKRLHSIVDTSNGVRFFYLARIEEISSALREKKRDLRRLQAQRNELNTRVRVLRDEQIVLQQPGSYIGEVVKAMGKDKVLVKVNLFSLSLLIQIFF